MRLQLSESAPRPVSRSSLHSQPTKYTPLRRSRRARAAAALLSIKLPSPSPSPPPSPLPIEQPASEFNEEEDTVIDEQIGAVEFIEVDHGNAMENDMTDETSQIQHHVANPIASVPSAEMSIEHEESKAMDTVNSELRLEVKPIVKIDAQLPTVSASEKNEIAPREYQVMLKDYSTIERIDQICNSKDAKRRRMSDQSKLSKFGVWFNSIDAIEGLSDYQQKKRIDDWIRKLNALMKECNFSTSAQYDEACWVFAERMFDKMKNLGDAIETRIRNEASVLVRLLTEMLISNIPDLKQLVIFFISYLFFKIPFLCIFSGDIEKINYKRPKEMRYFDGPVRAFCLFLSKKTKLMSDYSWRWMSYLLNCQVVSSYVLGCIDACLAFETVSMLNSTYGRQSKKLLECVRALASSNVGNSDAEISMRCRNILQHLHE
jgi:hypothetical protein